MKKLIKRKLRATKEKTKKCSTCNKRKKPADFYKNKKTPDGLTYECKGCTAAYQKKRYYANKAK